MKDFSPIKESKPTQSSNGIQRKEKSGKPEEENLKGSLVQRSIVDQAGDKSIQKKSTGNDTKSKMPEAVKAKMENSFGQDFSNVNIHEGESASAINAHAYTQGDNIHFAPGQYNPETKAGQELLGHELTHVVQQKKGGVQPSTQLKGVGINDDTALETEADVMGKKAASSSPANVSGSANDKVQLKAKTSQDVLDGISKYDEDILSSSTKYGISVQQIKSIIAVESAGVPTASSGAAFGLMQLTKDTWNWIQQHKSYPELKSYDFDSNWTDPKVNINFGTVALKLKLQTIGVDKNDKNFASLAVAAYNAGEGTIGKAIKNAKNGGSKDPNADCLKPEYLKPAIKDTKIYKYYLNKMDPKLREKIGEDAAIEDSIQKKYNEISRYPTEVAKYMALQNGDAAPVTSTGTATTNTSNANKSNSTTTQSSNAPIKPNSTAAKEKTYTVQTGETLAIIASKNGVSVEDIKKANSTKLKKWGNVEGFNAGESIIIKKASVPEQTVKPVTNNSNHGIMDTLSDYYDAAKNAAGELYDDVSSGISNFFGSMFDDEKTVSPATSKTNSTTTTTQSTSTSKAKEGAFTDIFSVGSEMIKEDRYQKDHAYIDYKGENGKIYKSGESLANEDFNPTWCNQFAMDLSKKITKDDPFANIPGGKLNANVQVMLDYMESSSSIFKELDNNFEDVWKNDVNAGKLVFFIEPTHISTAIPTPENELISRTDNAGHAWKFGRVVQAGSSVGVMYLNEAWGKNKFSKLKVFKYIGQ